MSNHYSKKQSILLLVLFLTLIGGMALSGLLLPDRSFSEIENRSLASFESPTLRSILNGKFMSNTDTYLSDQTPLRDQWMQLHARLETAIGKQDIEGICRTDEGNLIALLPEYDTTMAENNTQCVINFAAETGLPVSFGLIPTAADILSDQLPTGAPTLDEKAMTDRIYSMCDGSGLTLLDFRQALLSHKEEYIFYRTDHHWTSLGACYGAGVLLEARTAAQSADAQTTAKLPDPGALPKSTVTDSFYGTNCSRSGIFNLTPDTIDTYIPNKGLTVTAWHGAEPEEGSLYDPSYLDKKDKYSYFLGGNMPLCQIKTNSDGPKLLLIRDSYSSSMIPFLTPYYSEIHVLDMRYYRMSLKEYAREHDIDEVAVVYGLKTFLEDSNLAFLKK